MRAIISDFAVCITIFTMVLVDYALGVPSPKLKVPSVFKVSLTYLPMGLDQDPKGLDQDQDSWSRSGPGPP